MNKKEMIDGITASWEALGFAIQFPDDRLLVVDRITASFEALEFAKRFPDDRIRTF